MKQKEWRSFAWLAGILIWFAAALVSAQFANPNGDEPWYLTASEVVMRGELPYRDFAYTQTPLLPYVYGPILRATGFGLATGRYVTIFFSTLAVTLALALARRVGGNKAAWLTLLLLLVTPATLYFFVIVKTYALTTLFALIAVNAMFHPKPTTRSIVPLVSVLAAGAAMATRLSFAVLFGFICLYWLVRRQIGTVVLGACLSLLPLGLAAYFSNGNFLFDVIEFHLLRPVQQTTSGILNAPKALLAQGTIVAFAPIAILALAYFLLYSRSLSNRKSNGSWIRQYRFEIIIWVATLALSSVVHFLPNANLWEYQVPIFVLALPLLTTLIVVQIPKTNLWLIFSVWTLIALVATLPSWLLHGKVLFTPSNALERAAQVSTVLQRNGNPNEKVLGGFAEVALAAGMQVPQGNEMGVFSVTDELSAAEAKQRHFLTTADVTNLLQHCAVAFVITDDRQRVFPYSSPSFEYLDVSHWQQWSQLLNSNYEIIYQDSTNFIYRRQPTKCAAVTN